MNPDALKALAENAHLMGKAYAAYKEALIEQGVKEDEAERVARDTINIFASWDDETGEPCPLCGREQAEWGEL